MMKHIDLCSGIGGFALGFEWAGLSRPAMFCDIEPWSRKVLAKHWPDVPIEEDVKVLANEPEKIPAGGRDTILTAGYPCQPFSQAGKRLGTEDDRHIWPYIREIVAQKRPSWCVFENVYGHVSMGLDQVLLDLETDGYAARGFIVPACGVDAPHRRDRVWIIAHADSQSEPDVPRYVAEGKRMVADTDSKSGKVGRQYQTDATESLFRGSDARGSRSDDRGEFRTSANAADVGNPEHNGSPTTAVAGSAGKTEERSTQGQSKAEQSARTGRPRDDADVGNAEGIGRNGWAETAGREGQTHQQDEPRPEIRGELGGSGENVADTDNARCEEQWWGEPAQSQYEAAQCGDWWLSEPPVGRLANGIPNRVDQLKGLGNAIVPQIAMQIGIVIRQCEASATGQFKSEKE